MDLATSVVDQLIAVTLIGRTSQARAQRRAMLTEALAATEAGLSQARPGWTGEPVAGASGLWVDTHEDAVALAEHGKRDGLKLAAGPAFCTYGGQETYLRLPVWHDPEQLISALRRLA